MLEIFEYNEIAYIARESTGRFWRPCEVISLHWFIKAAVAFCIWRMFIFFSSMFLKRESIWELIFSLLEICFRIAACSSYEVYVIHTVQTDRSTKSTNLWWWNSIGFFLCYFRSHYWKRFNTIARWKEFMNWYFCTYI